MYTKGYPTNRVRNGRTPVPTTVNVLMHREDSTGAQTGKYRTGVCGY